MENKIPIIQSINESLERYKIAVWMVIFIVIIGFLIYGYAVKAELITLIGAGIILAAVIFEMVRPKSPVDKAYKLKRDFNHEVSKINR